ncbi:ArnT family glycosyltransferase [Commensalibacter oyaizuii]|uniref:Glycosyltransferase family 39 protein n=1 Tax=Commensalibacter oyaizuii TaxID=3043873 RepID=A0ABT6Q0U4_9PROT|nr:glycosyltransferase family 39 protein [Commensalibacter sp. TBRC 16381]MDI2090733.1 glycosyltransferase family 39 protein [Commensalibacter sp. TBRC 16381]
MKNSPFFWMCMGLMAITIVRVAIAANIPLSPDEAYYWIWSQRLDYSFYDHPPMVALWIKAGCFLWGNTALGIRFFGAVAALLGSIFIYFATFDFSGSLLNQQSKKNAIYAVLALNATLAVGVGSVTMTPDTPLLFFICMFLWACGRLLRTQIPQWWWMIGVSVGLGLLSKYTMLLPVMGLGIWCFLTPQGRSYLKSKELWGGAVVSCLVFSPVIFWNAHHQWISFLKQGGRAGDWRPVRAVQFLSELLGGQIGLSTPVLFICFCLGFAYLTRNVLKTRDQKSLLLWLMVFIPICIFVQHAIGDRVQANWVGILYPFLAIIVAVYSHKFLKVGIIVGFLLVIPIYVQAAFALFPVPPKLDITLKRLGGWQNFSQTLNRQVPSDQSIFTDEYGLGAEMAFYIPKRHIISVDQRWKYFKKNDDSNEQKGYGCLVRTQRRKDQPSSAYFKDIQKVGEIKRLRNNQTAEVYTLYKVRLINNIGQDTMLLPSAQ